MVAAGRSLRGERSTRSKLSTAEVLQVLAEGKRGGVNCEATGRRLGVTGAAIRKIIRGKTWRHLRSPAPLEFLARACTHDDAPCPGCLSGRACDGPEVYLPWLPGDELEAAL